jgi:transcriptional regulator with XRE-family HTH domain
MSDTADLLSQILKLGKEQGLRQFDIARRAGIKPESLSRAKKAGDMRASTLNGLARVVGMKLSLVPDKPLIDKIDSGTLFE